jgi:hypothetical protein
LLIDITEARGIGQALHPILFRAQEGHPGDKLGEPFPAALFTDSAESLLL